MAIEKEIKNLKLLRPAQSGFEYSDWPIIKPIFGKKDFEVINAHWEYIPAFIHDEFELREARKVNTWLNAKGENLFVNDKGRLSMYREGAINGRCLVLSSGFYEWRHIPKIGAKGQELKATDKIPYHIGVADKEYFFIAGVSRVWTNESRGQSADTFAIVTTEANDLMQQVHNSKKRMPVILPEALAYEWIFGELDQKRILEIARYQAVPFFMSIMFPTIFALGIKGLGEETKIASSFIVMSIVGGALFPLLIGKISDATGGNIQMGYIVPLICFVAVALFAWKGHQVRAAGTE